MADCFIIMPISTPDRYVDRYSGDANHFQHVLEHLFIPGITAAGLTPVPPIAEGSDIIHARIVENLERADMVLCDMSVLNANVFFEFGIRIALDKPVCVVQDDMTDDIPFDTSGINCFKYNSNLSPWHVNEQVVLLTEHIKKSSPDLAGTRSLWQYFGLSTRAHPPDAGNEETDKFDYLTLQIDAMRKQIERLEPPKLPSTLGFGATLRRLRTEIGFSQADVANEIGVSQVHISQLERGVARPSSEITLSLKELFGSEITLE